MTHLPVIRELQPLTKSKTRGSIARGSMAQGSNDRRSEVTATVWNRIVAAMTNPNFLAVVMFCVVGFLVAVNLILRFPDFGLTVEQFGQF